MDARGVLRILNETGTRTPLLWIFNTEKEPLKLATALGEDQPILFSRSAHLLLPPEADHVPWRRSLADYVLRQTEAHFPGTRLDLGTSCQGTGVATALCGMLPGARIDIGCLCIINCSLPEGRTNRPALLIYGQHDPRNDPFRADPAEGARRAAALFSDYRRIMVPARHGGFYDPEVLLPIWAAFDAFRADQLARGESSRASSPTVE